MGWPVAHSRSPAIHGHWIAQYGLNGAYVQLPVQPVQLEQALRALPVLGFAGCNLTIPHQVAALSVLDEVDAALDEANVDRFVGVLRDFLSSTQFIIVTHSKKTMAAATTLSGVTMEESGVSKRVSVRFESTAAAARPAARPAARAA